MVRLYLYVVVAPSRSAPRPGDDEQVRRARTFAQDAFPDVFDAVPTSAEEHMTLFAVEGDDGYREHQLYIHRTGLVELLWTLDYEATDDELTIDLVEIAYVVMRLAAAVGRKPYAELSKTGRGRRLRARVDWWFHAATGISGANGSRSWTALRFPGKAPPRARHEWAAAPPDGYGWQRLLNSRRRKPPDEVARVLLNEFLTANGYYEFADAVDGTLAAASARLDEQPSTPPSSRGRSCEQRRRQRRR